jgi:hypothetical protein
MSCCGKARRQALTKIGGVTKAPRRQTIGYNGKTAPGVAGLVSGVRYRFGRPQPPPEPRGQGH